MSNIINLLMGIIFGFFLMVIISCAFITKKLSKNNKNEDIREISSRNYTTHFSLNNKEKINDKIINSVIYEVQEVSKIVYPNKENPMFELSINDILNALILIQLRLKKIIDNPLCKDIKKIHISSIINLKEKIYNPAIKIYNNFFKVFNKILSIFWLLLNIINPLFYIKKFMKLFFIKKGKKDAAIICLDAIGNCCYDIYNRESNLQK
ncbi:MAG: hypothetical protein MR270_01680 [Erysipelotrichaceae bacterium]|nr:hypothetical protein [Erysipelotrichaceae bacterium]